MTPLTKGMVINMSTANNNPVLKPYAQELRKNMTREEKHLWYDFLKHLRYTVNRQKVIGEYIVDFCIPSKKLIIELDGSQHFEPEAVEYDKRRDAYLASRGYVVLRYMNTEINKNFEGVCMDILNHMKECWECVVMGK